MAVAAASVVRAVHTIAAARAIPAPSPPRAARLPGEEVDGTADRTPQVTVIVPARNEERVLEECLTGLAGQGHPRLSVVVVDDDSTDRTGAVAARHAEQDPRFRVVRAGGLPAGWLGKLHAMHRGLQAAEEAGLVDRDGWLLFLDADTVPAPDLVQRLTATAEDRQLDLVSTAGGPPADAGAVWWLLMPPGSQVISEHASPVAGRRALALGHCLMVRQRWFDRVGGWEARPAVGNEDIALATAVRAAGGTTRFLRSDGAVLSRGVDPFGAGWASFRKSFTVGVRRSVPMLLAAGVAHVAFGLTPGAAVLVGARRRSPLLVTAGLVGGLAQASGHLQATRVTGGPAASTVLASASWVCLGGMFLDAARTAGRSQWKGRRMDDSRRPATARPERPGPSRPHPRGSGAEPQRPAA